MRQLFWSRKAFVGVSFLTVMAALGAGQLLLRKAIAQSKEAPRFEVDPFWPKPMPNNWVLGQTIGVAVDSRDHIWIVHRGWDPAALDNTELAVPISGNRAGQRVGECCNPSPPIMEFDQAGNLVNAWGGPSPTGEYEWPTSNHGIAVDADGFVYIGGNGAGDAHVLKFTRDGKFVAQWGRANARQVKAAAMASDPMAGYAGVAPGGGVPAAGAAAPAAAPATPTYQANSHDQESFGRVAKIDLVEDANEAYLSDGYLNHRVAVVDMDTGKIKRYWGAYGKPPTDEVLPPYDPAAPVAQQFRNPVHCSNVSKDGFVYVCDRPNDRIQIFRTDGTFVKEVFVATQTLADGSVWDIDFSHDPEQRFLYVADGVNEHVRVFNRQTMEELYNFGYGGRQPGMFLGVHSIAVDSKGNIYTTETYTGKRLQKFVNKGIGPVTTVNAAMPWPTAQ
ncbi:beta-propeller fold lactonase family protein [Microvirga makkahensis]|uniref:Beta-propeller fold lactonase family protein n=1 Tax=Microvirga makkahensis TaxID=1128670 RepID=A0A7X3MS74_9HYPH|nr:beta-propeller fold lactonase family protein [Microvirga makkahensis]MXQ12247.1 beta-propeller fold lactonase family protein [Microvirga makkahensis]